MLYLKNVSKKYNSSKSSILKNIDLEFGETGLVTILGSSGSGKSTLLNLIGGIDDVSSGSIYFYDSDITKFGDKELNNYHSNYISFIYQNYNLINNMSVSDNINLFNDYECDELMYELGILKYKNKLVSDLSGGERQRVAIARALAKHPKILLCDEPTGALDHNTGLSIMSILKKLSKHILVIMVTHDENLATSFSDRIIRISDGRIISDSSTKVKRVKRTLKIKKQKVLQNKIINIIENNIKSKLKRNILIVIAFSIGLISLSLVFAISNGFTESLKREEKSSLSEYPIILSEDSTNALEELNNIFNEKDERTDFVIPVDTYTKNNLDERLMSLISSIDSKYKIINYYHNDYVLTNVSLNVLTDSKLLSGKKTLSNNELIIMLDSKNHINREFLSYFNLDKDHYEFNELLNKEIKINNKKYKVVGVIKNSDNSILNEVSGIITNETFNKILSISLYPKDHNNKEDIINTLRDNTDVKFTDYAESITSISTTLIKGVTLVLTCFSIVSLLVTMIMISVITIVSIMERTKDIGIFKSLGINNIYIKEIFILEYIFLGIIASILSTYIVDFISKPINNLILDKTGLTDVLLLTDEYKFLIILISVLFAILGSIIPLNKISKIKIIDTLKYE